MGRIARAGDRCLYDGAPNASIGGFAAGLDSSVRGLLGLGAGSLLCLIPVLVLPILTPSQAVALCECALSAPSMLLVLWGMFKAYVVSVPPTRITREIAGKLGRWASEDELEPWASR